MFSSCPLQRGLYRRYRLGPHIAKKQAAKHMKHGFSALPDEPRRITSQFKALDTFSYKKTDQKICSIFKEKYEFKS